MSLSFTYKQKCVICGCKYEYPIVSSTSSFCYSDLDMRPPEIPKNCFEYEIQECPRCHYANESIEDLIPYCSWDTLRDPFYQNIVNDNNIAPTAKSYMLAACLYDRADLYREAGIYFLRAAWVYDDRLQEESAVQMRKKAVACLLKYDNPFENPEIDVIIVDVYRRIGGYNEAKRHANKLIENGILQYLKKYSISN